MLKALSARCSESSSEADRPPSIHRQRGLCHHKACTVGGGTEGLGGWVRKSLWKESRVLGGEQKFFTSF